jgi:hypothetical protein
MSNYSGDNRSAEHIFDSASGLSEVNVPENDQLARAFGDGLRFLLSRRGVKTPDERERLVEKILAETRSRLADRTIESGTHLPRHVRQIALEVHSTYAATLGTTTPSQTVLPQRADADAEVARAIVSTLDSEQRELLAAHYLRPNCSKQERSDTEFALSTARFVLLKYHVKREFARRRKRTTYEVGISVSGADDAKHHADFGVFAGFATTSS